MFYTNRNTPRSLILAIDVLIVVFSIFIAYLLRFNFHIPTSELKLLPIAFLIIVTTRFLSFLLSKIFAGIIRYTETQDILRVFYVSAIGTILISAFTFGYYFSQHLYLIPRAVIIIEFISTSVGLVLFRLLVKVAYNELRSPNSEKRNIIIFGAGEAGFITKSTLTRETGIKNNIIAFFDDDRKKTGKTIDKIPIKSGSELNTFIESNLIDLAIIAVQNINPTRKKEIAEICLAKNIKVQDLPPVSKWINGELSLKQIKDINIVDLLERDEIKLNEDLLVENYSGKKIMVTGAAGSIGSELVRQIARLNPGLIIVYDQAETPMFNLEMELISNGISRFEMVIGDIRDKERLRLAIKTFTPDVVLHAAAYKHVPLMENNPAEAVKTNIFGTRNLADLCDELGVKKFIMVSTDKAVNPTNVMGATKRVAEIYIQTLNKKSSTRFITTRFGNVLGSNGSVIPLFKKQIEERQPITITHPEVTRFFMTIPEASQLVLEAGASGNGGEIFVFDMGKSVKIVDLAKKMIQLSGLTLGKDIELRFTGLRPGEKLYEELLATEENTIPTHNKKILKAKVRDYEPDEVGAWLTKIEEVITNGNNYDIVSVIKKIVPEFKSNNSTFEALDKIDG